MDRLEPEVSRIRAQDPAATLQDLPQRPPTSPVRGRPVPDRTQPTGDPGQGRSNLRLDPGHHRSQSRWLPHEGRSGRSTPPDATPRCVALVASREARTLAAMVNWIAGPAATDAGRASDAGRCLASTGGRSATDPAGLVEFWPASPPAGDYLLTHAQVDADARDSARPALVERYSLTPGTDWWAGDLKRDAGRYRFRAFRGEAYHAEVKLGVPGLHQILPALASLAIAGRLDLPRGEVLDRLADFPGLPRGFESRGTFRGATLVDDEATGPGALGDALRLAREVFGRRIIRAVFLAGDDRDRPSPRDFDEADHLILIEPGPFGAESTRLLGASLRSSGASVAICPSLDDAVRGLDRDLEPGDVLVTLGAAGVGTIADALLRRLSRDRHGR